MATIAEPTPGQQQDSLKKASAGADSPVIEELVSHCGRGFERAKVCFDEALLEQSRFHEWASRVHAMNTEGGSLQYRLRKSHELTAKVKGYLTEIRDALHDQGNLRRAAGVNRGCSSKGSSVGAAVVGSSESATKRLESQSLTIKKIADVITCLESITPALLDPVKDAGVGDAYSIEDEAVYSSYFNHIRAQFGTAQHYVAMTLARALSRNQRYFSYLDACNVHQENPEAGSSDKRKQHIEYMYTPREDEPRKLPQQPPLPLAGVKGDLFECPFCYNVIHTADQRSWQQHVREDLFPFTCTATYCRARGCQFARLSDLADHYREHEKSLHCPFQCPITFTDRDAFIEHMGERHESDALPGDAESNMLQYLPRVAEQLDMNTCPLCFRCCKDAENYFTHFGQHMEQLALFSLPSRRYRVAADSEPVSHQSGASKETEPASNVTRKHPGALGDMFSKLTLKR